MKIYTKRGDKGFTSTFGGSDVPKSHVLVEAYGEVDELNSHLGVVASFFYEQESEFILKIQDYLFVIGAHLATDKQEMKKKLPNLSSEPVEMLEKEIDRMEEVLPKMTHFILPGKNFEVGYIHVARTVCRRAERAIVGAKVVSEIDELIVQFINRLSDYLFVLARYRAKMLGIEEVKWNV